MFARRRERHWYKADVTERPPQVDFDSWSVTPAAPGLPHLDPSWSDFWRDGDARSVSTRP
jgi:hypothetical protein